MLPGFRFLFAAIMLSMSLLVFGLGAAALLRAAHESFASNSSWRATPEVTFAQRSETMLATLRVDTPVVEKAPETTPPASSTDTAPATSAPATSEQVAAVRPVDAARTETTTSESAPPAIAPPENPSPAATPPAAETTTTGDQTVIAAITPPDASSGASEPTTAQPAPTKAEPASASQETPAAGQPSIAATKIATLGGPPVDIIEDTVKSTPSARDKTEKPDQAKNDPGTIKRRVQARRVLHRRRLAARARLAAQQQLQANPFGQQPFPATTTTAPHP